jgi:hypothetical protein
MIKPGGDAAPAPQSPLGATPGEIVVVQNWDQELKRLVPSP